ncbi:glycerophosphodiester phosphodiesterase family protein [Roseinatronobacter alkalisoli]|uniref:Glycerophosphodiester phosphodiesterase family protein n=1 Tax=Roseinatronobacter alkalisoli TaxID=3028235 RepID=A0ABT5T7M0_9RHOB|nr:glycerophosphodiester phosphodiesterase family protein [Roseinatronobacter sp. HJB301]MDD7971127.1 glycerophosphodiester phosphodiesterase family protein [Roseinatronobacter sp. HJB301]
MTNFLRRPAGHPRIYGHRGARSVLPENTMAGFAYLRETGVTAVELDVQNARGRVPVIIHDPLLPMAHTRDAQGNWLPAPGPKVIDLTVDELRSYDIGRLNPATEYAARYPLQRPQDGARIPTLAEFLEWAQADSDLLINIEIKSHAHQPDLGDAPEILAADVAGMVQHSGLAARVVVSSFDWRVLSALRVHAPDIARAYLSFEQPGQDTNIIDGGALMDGLNRKDFGGSLPALIAAQGAKAWCPYFGDLTPAELAQAHAHDLAVNVWTVNADADIRRMIAMGVDGIISDDPARAQYLLDTAA